VPKFKVVFYYKHSPSYKGEFYIMSENEWMASKAVYKMVEDKNELIPENWDFWTISQVENEKCN
jgi:hypothetical protein